MTNYKYDVMLTLRMPAEVRARLKEVAAKEQRTVSSVALRAIEIGLNEWETHGFVEGDTRARGEAFERAVVNILIDYGLLAASRAVASTNTDDTTFKHMPSRTTRRQQSMKKRSSGSG